MIRESHCLGRWGRSGLFAFALGLAALTLILSSTPAAAQDESETASASEASSDDYQKRPVLFYIPNRIFDLLDIVRLRLRLGPGVAVNARVTEAASLNAGAYGSVFVGIPGPRNERRLNLPVGMENYAGVGISVADAETEAFGPGYGPLETGLGFHAALIGIDLGIEPLDLIDFVTGIVFIDIRNDDF